MSFIDFLKNVGKILFGVGGSVALGLVATALLIMNEVVLGVLVLIPTFILFLFAIYQQRQLDR